MELSFIDPKLIRRIENSPKEKDLLRNSLGKGTFRILDATAGLCRDSLRMSYWGHKVWACERDVELGKMLESSLAEARAHEFYQDWIERLSFYPGATESFLKENPEITFDIVVIDSMFPDEKRKGLPKKNIQELKALVSDDSDNAAELLTFCHDFAWKQKPKKILVKRPLKAPALDRFRVSHSFEGRSHRWDLYLP